LLFTCSCSTGPERAPAIGEAYVGPSTLKIRSDIPLQSAVVATVKHGDRLEIIQRRRRFFKVRTRSGAEGWTDERQLLAKEDMDDLRELSKQAKNMLAQGQATTFGDLNVHTQPWRLSPSFVQFKEGEKVDVLMHRQTPRTDTQQRKPLLPPPQKKVRTATKKPKEEPRYPPPPLPPPPPPPANWLDLSKTAVDDEANDDGDDDKPASPVPVDDWSLVRLANGTSGWVLTRRLVMAIPDEVAQYAEGRRIVSYFPLGEVEDGDARKHNWLWTTIGSGTYPYDFDSFRVFIWSLRRHRYETAYIERNIRGYAPVLLRDVALENPSKARGAPAAVKYPGFAICMERKDAPRALREYAFISNIVRYAGEKPCEAPPPATQKAPVAGALPGSVEPQPQPPAETFAQRFKRRLKAATRGWFGR
jgi:hypothetical protein